MAEEQPLFEEEEEEEEEEDMTGGSDAQDEGGQAGEHCTGSQFLM